MRIFAALIAVFLAVTALRAETPSVENETLGRLSLGLKSEAVEGLLGKPARKSPAVFWSATGEWVEQWFYPTHGLELALAATKKNGKKTLLSISADDRCTLKTSRGIGIGSSETAVRKAYAREHDRETSVRGEQFVAGSLYGGVIFSIRDGKVDSIFLGAAAE